jgi:hypothetical protein
VRAAISQMQASPLANYIPYTSQIDAILERLVDLQPRTLAIVHDASFAGDGERALRDLAIVMRETLGGPSERR